jgi:hypothetical protein
MGGIFLNEGRIEVVLADQEAELVSDPTHGLKRSRRAKTTAANAYLTRDSRQLRDTSRAQSPNESLRMLSILLNTQV